jgi:hypothetical protein
MANHVANFKQKIADRADRMFFSQLLKLGGINDNDSCSNQYLRTTGRPIQRTLQHFSIGHSRFRDPFSDGVMAWRGSLCVATSEPHRKSPSCPGTPSKRDCLEGGGNQVLKPIKGPGTSQRATLEPRIRELLGDRLRTFYAATQRLPLPDSLTDVIEKLAHAEEEGSG